MAVSPKDSIKRFKVRLLQELPLDDPIFFAMVERDGLVPLDNRDSIRAETTRARKVNCFLDNVVEPGADVYLPKLLKIMRESSVANVRRLADDIQTALQPGVYFTYTYTCACFILVGYT